MDYQANGEDRWVQIHVIEASVAELVREFVSWPRFLPTKPRLRIYAVPKHRPFSDTIHSMFCEATLSSSISHLIVSLATT